MGRKKVTEDPHYEYFIKPSNSATNNTISQELDENDFIKGLKDTGGHKHDLWRCSLDFIKMMMASRIDNTQLEFRTFCRNKLTGDLTEFRYTPSKPVTKAVSKEIKKIFARLNDMTLNPVT